MTGSSAAYNIQFFFGKLEKTYDEIGSFSLENPRIFLIFDSFPTEAGLLSPSKFEWSGSVNFDWNVRKPIYRFLMVLKDIEKLTWARSRSRKFQYTLVFFTRRIMTKFDPVGDLDEYESTWVYKRLLG